MKLFTLLPLAVTASALVLPDAQVFEQILAEQEGKANDHHDQLAAWWDKIPSKDEVISKAEETASDIWADLDNTVNKAKDKISAEFEDLLDLSDAAVTELADHPRHPHKPSDKTIWELISNNKYTTRFAEIVSNYSDIVAHLSNIEVNSTLFVPSNRAFEHIPPHDGDEDDDEKKERIKKFIHSVLQYHIVDGVYPARRLLYTHTLPTTLKEPFLGGEPQRLRVQVGLHGLGVNFFTRVIKPNIPASNGIIHAVDHIIVPPPFVGRELSLVPSIFSTLLLAYDKTHFVDFIHNVKTEGSTVFAPTNGAFAKLGLAANAFLFNSPKGLKYLEALLKYQIVANVTLYSDKIYNKLEHEVVEEGGVTRAVAILPTLLHDIKIIVMIRRWAGFASIKVNGRGTVVIKDGVAKNGVLQIVDQYVFWRSYLPF